MLERVDYRTLQQKEFLASTLEGLAQPQKTLPSRWLYDDRGSELFETIARLDEYYLTRTETAILSRHANEIARFCGENCVLLEYGAGAGVKTEILIGALVAPRLYVPIDIAGDFLDLTVKRIRDRFARLETLPVIADFTVDFELPREIPQEPRAAFFPGSTIGNLDQAATISLLRRVHRQVGQFGSTIIGVDLKKDVKILLAAYDDREGVTAAFNLNLLVRINRELGGDFPPERFVHEARWNDVESAVEMHLVSLDARTVSVAGRNIQFERGESIHTESSRKYDISSFSGVAAESGWRVAMVWEDPNHQYGVFGLLPAW